MPMSCRGILTAGDAIHRVAMCQGWYDESVLEGWQPFKARRSSCGQQVRRGPQPHDAHVDTSVRPTHERLPHEIENHAAAVALYLMDYNCGQVHQTLRVTSAGEAGVSDHVGSVEEVVALLG